MSRYIATKAVRFDRDYAVGEEIPEEVINPRNVKRLIEWGKIQRITNEEAVDHERTRKNVESISVSFLEEVLRIDNGDKRLSLEERTDICFDRIAELSKVADRLAADIGEADAEPDAEVPQDPNDDIGDAPSGTEDPAETEQELAEAATAEGFPCPVCGKLCKTKAALTTHLKTHNK